jgi:hypothetical protein
VRLGRRFEAPTDVRAFTAELERYFARELAVSPPWPMPASNKAGAVEGARQIRG